MLCTAMCEWPLCELERVCRGNAGCARDVDPDAGFTFLGRPRFGRLVCDVFSPHLLAFPSTKSSISTISTISTIMIAVQFVLRLTLLALPLAFVSTCVVVSDHHPEDQDEIGRAHV